MTRIAIVTTLVDSDKLLKTWIKYHLGIGFDHLYLFFDNPSDPSIHETGNDPRITSIVHDEKLKAAWLETRAYAKNEAYRKFIEKEVMARQILNLEVACNMAVADNIDWVLHIDLDELFFSPEESVKDYFHRLSQQGIRHKNFVNYEAIPEDPLADNYFERVMLFKKNALHRSVPEKISYKLFYNNTFFNFYECGKSAAIAKDVDFPGIHKFEMFNPAPEPLPKTSILRKLKFNYGVREPIILHYPVCSFSSFWNKFKTLGTFTDKWFETVPMLPFYMKARDIIAAEDKNQGLTFYAKNVMISRFKMMALRFMGIVVKINYPSRLLGIN